MATVIYRKGKTHVFKGVSCDMKSIPFSARENYLKHGWYDGIDNLKKALQEEKEQELKEKEQELEDLKEEEADKAKDLVKEYALEETSEKEISTANDEIIKKMAKDLKIDNWEKKTVKTLRRNLILLKKKLEKEEDE